MGMKRCTELKLVLADAGLNKYKKYIDGIAAQPHTESAQQLSFALVIEPDLLGNIVTDPNIPKCAGGADAFSNSWDKQHYVNSLVPHLEENGQHAHFIVDQGRSGSGVIRTP
ncbi:hypothetical protein NLJ89_g2931 [Agrocybe chaxingu]|uniref:Uncharacterized protein n=1 Tax=Agrocybe chaxingu TaxID=84603 RepID=A0A9W8K4Z0_9AGAR|nr:hypothetical protein NLJ89_g2931 [Agrocybe chaxingu]